MKKRDGGQPEKTTARDGLPEILPPCDDRIFREPLKSPQTRRRRRSKSGVY
jgi:hypothetical protein